MPQAPLSQLKAEAAALAGDLGTLTTSAVTRMTVREVQTIGRG